MYLVSFSGLCLFPYVCFLGGPLVMGEPPVQIGLVSWGHSCGFPFSLFVFSFTPHTYTTHLHNTKAPRIIPGESSNEGEGSLTGSTPCTSLSSCSTARSDNVGREDSHSAGRTTFTTRLFIPPLDITPFKLKVPIRTRT